MSEHVIPASKVSSSVLVGPIAVGPTPLPPPSRGQSRGASRHLALYSSQSQRSVHHKQDTLGGTISSTRSTALMLKQSAPAVPLHLLSNWPSTPSAFDLRPATVKSDGSFTSRESRSRPPLAVELEAFLKKELHAISQALRRPPTIFERLPIFAEVFGTLTTHFVEYSEILSAIKREYDLAAQEGGSAAAEVFRLRADAMSSKDFYAHMLDCDRQKWDEAMRSLTHDLKLAKDDIETLRKRERMYLDRVMKYEDQLTALRTENEELQSRGKLLADTLRTETIRQSVLVAQGKKLKTDNDRLQHLCKEMEIKIKNDQVLLVSQGQGPGGMTSAGGFTSFSSQPGLIAPARKQQPQPPAGLQRQPSIGPGMPHPAVTGGSIARKPSFMEVTGRVLSQQKLTEVNSPVSVSEFATPDDVTEALFDARGKIKRLMRIVARLTYRVREQQKSITSIAEQKSRRPMTPRPQWTALVEVVPELSPIEEAESSADYLIRAAEHIQEAFSEQRLKLELKARSKTIQEWFADENKCESDLVTAGRKSFIGLGTGPHVPVYLRYHGFVRHNSNYSKGDVERWLKEFWELRQSRTRAEGLEVKPIDEFFLEWLKETAKDPTELAYNFLDICEKSRSDPDCGMFLAILQGRVSEATLVDQLSVVERLKYVLEHNDRSKTGCLPRRMLHDILRKFFPAKNKDCMLKLRFALIPFTKDTPRGATVSYVNAFEEDDEGNQTRFIELIREQHLDEITEHTVDVEEALREVLNGEKMPIGPAKTAIKLLDPAIPADELNAIIAHGAFVTVEQLDSLGETHQVPAEQFLARIRTGRLLKRYSKKAVEESSEDEDELAEIESRANEVGLAGSMDQSEVAEIGREAESEGGSDTDGSVSEVQTTSEEDEIDFTEFDAKLTEEAISANPETPSAAEASHNPEAEDPSKKTRRRHSVTFAEGTTESASDKDVSPNASRPSSTGSAASGTHHRQSLVTQHDTDPGAMSLTMAPGEGAGKRNTLVGSSLH